MQAEFVSLSFQGDDALVAINLIGGSPCENRACDAPNLIVLHKRSGKKVAIAPESCAPAEPSVVAAGRSAADSERSGNALDSSCANTLTYRLGLGKAGNLADFNDVYLRFSVEVEPGEGSDAVLAKFADQASAASFESADQAPAASAGSSEPVPVTRGSHSGRKVAEAVVADHSNEFFFTKDEGELCLKIHRTWRKYDDTEEKRCRIRRRLYPLMRHLPLNKKKVMFESFSKRTYSDNPKAIYEELVARDLGYECVWALTNEKTDVGPEGKTVRYGSLEYWYHVATAKYLVSNYNQYRIVKRRGQIMVNTMHGVPLKHMGLSVAKKDTTKASMRRLFDSWDYFVTPCDFLSDILRSDHFGFKGQFIQAGYPRNDVLLRECNDPDRVAKVRANLGVPAGKKVILWAPTWRTKKRFDLKLDLAAMKEALSDEYVLVLRSHYLESQFVPEDIYDDFVLNGHAYENVNEMLYAADVLITDYSSIMFDYSLLCRPMIIFAWDYDKYMGKSRGIYFDIRAEYPGLMAETTDLVIDRLAHQDEVMEEVTRFHDRFNQYDQGDAAVKVVDALWDKREQG